MSRQGLRNHVCVTSPEHQRRAREARRWRSGLVGLLLLFPAAAHAQSELFTPYNINIVVHVAENRMLTDVFRGRIERELRDGFQAALGDMGRVNVTHEHPRLAEVLTRGLRSLDDWKDRDDKKTHFVLIDYSGVHYEIRARQYDGTVGLASPVVRRDRTRDRDFVAKAAALLIKQDFGVVGTVGAEPEGANKQVKIELRGGGLGDMMRWVKKDDVFALASPSGGSSLALRSALLQVEEAPAEDRHDGVCKCRFFSRYQLAGGIAGYRCIKLGTVRTALHLRWLQRLPNSRVKPLDKSITVEIRRFGFEGEETTKLLRTNDKNGVLETVRDGNKGVFDNVAFVRVIDGLGNTLIIPLALVDDQPLSIEVSAPKDSDSWFALRKKLWQEAVANSVQNQASLFKRLEKLGAKPENRGEIIQLAKFGRQRAQLDRAALAKEKSDLAKERQDLKTPIEDQRLKQLENYQQVLARFIEEQEQIEKTENDPQVKKWRSDIQRAKLLEKDLEIEKAIKIYTDVLAAGFRDDEGALGKHLAQLQKEWEPCSGEHKEAREFIYNVWPALKLEDLEEKLPTAQKAFKRCTTCKKDGDLIAIKKMYLGTLGHADQLKKKLDELQPDWIAADEKEAQQFKKITVQIANLGEEIQRYLKAHANDK